MRIVVARRLGKRGEGLGNEAVTWAKGFIASQVLQARLIGPSFGINRRRYYRNFGTARFDVVLEEMLTRLPHYAFNEQDYRETGEVELGRALAKWSAARRLDRKSSFIVTVHGMFGGYPAIRNARYFLWSKMLSSRDSLQNSHQAIAALDPKKLFVAVHMRLGKDFDTLQKKEDPRGRFNIHIPADWYLSVCQGLKDAFGDSVQFHFCTDRRSSAFDEAVQRFNPAQQQQRGLTECSDLVLMAHADLRLCSVSSYSMLASFLADGPYVWYEPQLIYEEGHYTLWGNEPAQRLSGSLTSEALEATRSLAPDGACHELFRGWPIGEDGMLPPGLVAQLRRRLAAKASAGDLLNFGVVPDWALQQA